MSTTQVPKLRRRPSVSTEARPPRARHEARIVLVWLAVVIGLAFVADRALAAVLDRVALASEFRFSRLYSGRIDTDIIVLGNSRAVNGFDTRAMKQHDLAAFNLGYNGVPSDVGDVIFNDFLRYNPAPRLVILEVTNLLGSDEALNDFRVFVPHSRGLLLLTEAENSKIASALRVSHLFGFNSEMFFRALYYTGRSDQTWINTGRLSPAVIAAVDTMQAAPMPQRADRLARLVETVNKARARNIEVRLVVTPYFQPYAAKLTNLEPWIAAVEQATGERVWNYARALYNPDFFADRLHLNRNGSSAFLNTLLGDGFFLPEQKQER
jgi:hypothetical protein